MTRDVIKKSLIILAVYFVALMVLCEILAFIWNPFAWVGVVIYAICAFLILCKYSEVLNEEAEDWLKT